MFDVTQASPLAITPVRKVIFPPKFREHKTRINVKKVFINLHVLYYSELLNFSSNWRIINLHVLNEWELLVQLPHEKFACFIYTIRNFFTFGLHVLIN